MRKVLFVAYLFPPIGGIGVQRTLQFVKYLPQFGWQPIVLTVGETQEYVYDEDLMTTLSDDVSVYRARSWEPLNAARMKQVADRIDTGEVRTASSPRLGASVRRQLIQGLKPAYFALQIPDDKIGWYPFARSLGKEILANEEIDLIYATAPPFTNFLVGNALKQQSGKPLIIDYRDEWSTNQYRTVPVNRLTKQAHRKLEQRVLRNADMVISALPTTQDVLRNAGLGRQDMRYQTIMNGFDPDDYSEIECGDLDTPDKFVIAYTGSFYGSRRTPDSFLRAFRHFLDGEPGARDHVEVRFVGGMQERYINLIHELGVADLVRVEGISSRGEALRHQCASDLLLLVVGNGVGSEVVLTGKIFEYLGAERPILALVPENGRAATLVRSTNTGRVVDADDVPAIGAALADLYRAWSTHGIEYTPNKEIVEQYNRRRLTAQLAETFDALLDDTQ